MKEIKTIVAAFDQAQKESKKTALITLVHVEGSSYRRPGARMLITEDGLMTGAISGGCLEGDALRKALLVIAEKKSKLVTYDTNDEDEAQLGLGLGCNGIINVLIEPVNAEEKNHPIELLQKSIASSKASVLITLFSLENKRGNQPGTALLYEENNVWYRELPDIELSETILRDAEDVFCQGVSSIKNYLLGMGSLTAFLEYIPRPVSLVVVGAGNDALPLINMAALMGWDTTVADGRSEYASKNRFESTCRIVVARPEKVLSAVVADEQTVFVLMTHNYNYDLALLRQLVNYNTKYIGVLGPRKKLKRMLAEMEENNGRLSQEQVSKIYGPVGLDIGAETPEEIALSIIAEIKAVLSCSQGRSLREKQTPIHASINQITEFKENL